VRREPATPLVDVRGLSVDFRVSARDWRASTVRLRAVDDVSLHIDRGETLSLVGESGCGKTTVGRTLLRLHTPSAGTVRFDGADVAALSGRELRAFRRRTQMIFQDPYASLDPRMKVEDIVAEPLRAHRAGGRAERRERVRALLERVGLPADSANRFPHAFSGGQRQRIGIARALALEPDFVVADEPVSALDVSVQAQIVNLLKELQERLSLTVLLISHDLAVVRHVSSRVAVMYLGSVVETASRDELFAQPMHPYTRALRSASPVPDPVVERERERIVLRGDIPSPINAPPGCRFHTRCPFAQPARCPDQPPPLRRLGTSTRTVACHYAEEIASGRILPHAPEHA
jgi:peptide/nickel transport system ATP-binding protein